MQIFLRQAVFDGGVLAFAAKGSPVEDIPLHDLHRTFLAYYRILRACPLLPRYLKWDLTLLHRLFSQPHPDRGVCWLAIRCYAMQTCMGESTLEEIEKSVLGEIAKKDCIVAYGEDISGDVNMTDAWMLPVTESLRIQKGREDVLGTEIGCIAEDSTSRPIKQFQLRCVNCS